MIAYDAAGSVVATLDQLVEFDDTGHALRRIDFEARESTGGKLRDLWDVERAVRSVAVQSDKRGKHA